MYEGGGDKLPTASRTADRYALQFSEGHSGDTHRSWQRTLQVPTSLGSTKGIVTHVFLMGWNVLGWERSDPYGLTN